MEDRLITFFRVGAAAAISAMGIRVAEWLEPGGPIAVADVAESYAEFARKMLA